MNESKDPITFEDFTKLDLRIGVILSAERIPRKDKLLDLRVLVDEGALPRRIIAGIGKTYDPETLVGKRVVVLCNLPPRDFGKGMISEGMLLAADDATGPSVLTTHAGTAPGTRVG